MSRRFILYVLLMFVTCAHAWAQEDVRSLEVRPAHAVLVPGLPDTLHILSVGNSLIEFSHQDRMFVDMAQVAGYPTQWTPRHILSHSLSNHWSELDLLGPDGNPGAKMLVRSYPWTHIILQDLSVMASMYYSTFIKNATQWVDYIRTHCPNPNVVIVMPMNWARTNDWGFIDSYTDQLGKAYTEAALLTGATICPVGEAYRQIYNQEGDSVAAMLYKDNLHPSGLSGYLVSAMELSLITGTPVEQITWLPDSIDATQAAMLKRHAAKVLERYGNVVDQHRQRVNYKVRGLDADGNPINHSVRATFSASGGGEMEFSTFVADGQLGTYDVVATAQPFTAKAQVAVAQRIVPEPVTLPFIAIEDRTTAVTQDFNSMTAQDNASLPTGWRVDGQQKALRSAGYFDMASDCVSFSKGVDISSTDHGGTAVFTATTDAADHAVGGIPASYSDSPVAINVYAHMVNTGTEPLYQLQLAYDVEKYRNGEQRAGMAVQVFYSADGRMWIPLPQHFNSYWDPDVNSSGSDVVPMATQHVEHHIHRMEIAPGEHFYLAWNLSVPSGQFAARSMVLGLDNVKFSFSRRSVTVEQIEFPHSLALSNNQLEGEGTITVLNMQGATVACGRQTVRVEGLCPGVYVARDQAGHVLKFAR